MIRGVKLHVDKEERGWRGGGGRKERMTERGGKGGVTIYASESTLVSGFRLRRVDR